MLKARQCFEGAKARGDAYIVYLQKKQQDSEPLTFAVSGNWGKVQFAKMEYTSTSLYGGGGDWGYSSVGVLDTSKSWDEQKKLLEVVSFEW